jgi:hypothetical protein
MTIVHSAVPFLNANLRSDSKQSQSSRFGGLRLGATVMVLDTAVRKTSELGLAARRMNAQSHQE